MMKLYYSPNLNPRVAVAVARHLGSPVEFVRCSPQHPASRDAFLAINPNALVPILVEDGRRLWETDAIACRLSSLAGSDFWRTGDDQPEMILWISWATHHLNSAASLLYFERLIRPTFSDEAAAPEVIDEALGDFRRHSAVLDAALEGRVWLLGDRLSYADFRAATALPFADGAGLPLENCSNLKRWHDQLLALDAWRTPFEGLD
jgi:glutathione S-transferase